MPTLFSLKQPLPARELELDPPARQPRKKLPEAILEQIKHENLQMGRGDLHPKKVGEIKSGRDNLRALGFKVSRMPVCDEVEARPSSRLGKS